MRDFLIGAAIGIGVFAFAVNWQQESKLDRLERQVRALCTHGESSTAARKLPSGRVVTVLPATTTGCVPGR